jgi:6-phosphogluconolactonase
MDVPNQKGQMEVCADSAAVAKRAADLFLKVAQESKSQGRFTVALSGGSTPKALYSLLAAPPYVDQVPWEIVTLFWGDERCVPPDHQDSNYRMTKEAMLSKVPLSESQIHRIEGELDPQVAADKYSQVLQNFFGGLPRFDLVFLGMGDDGHTASLIPGTTALQDNQHTVVANWVEKFNTYRVTLTAKVINNAALVNFLIVGDSKTKVLKEVLEGPADQNRLPSQLIKPTNGKLLWLVDRTASGDLSFVH